jgi:hypothetical protein
MSRFALALALVPATVGVASTDAPHASRPDVGFGAAVTLSGKFAHGLAEQPVVLMAKEHGEKTYSSNALLTTSSGGRWKATVSPTIETSYEASSLGEQTPPVRIGVRPRVTLARRNGRFLARVVSTASYQHRYVVLQRRGARGWKTLKRIVLSTRPRRFHVTLPRGVSRVRLWLPGSQAGAGYLPSTSETVLVRR